MLLKTFSAEILVNSARVAWSWPNWLCQKLLFHSLYVHLAESMTWQRCKDGSTTPPALAAHTLTAVGQHGILCFGGQGKRVYNAVHKLDPASCLWGQFKTIGVSHACFLMFPHVSLIAEHGSHSRDVKPI